MEYTKSVKLGKICMYKFYIPQSSQVCFDSFSHYWYYLNQPHEVVTWNGFSSQVCLVKTYLVGCYCPKVYDR